MLTLGIASLGAVEASIGVLVVHRLVPKPWAAGIDVTLIAMTAALLVVVASPLASRLQVGAHTLVVPFGLLGCLRIPLDAIESLATVHVTAGPGVPLGLGIEHETLTVSRGGAGGQLSVVLARPLTARYQCWRTAPVTKVELAVGDPQGVLASVRRHSFTTS
jgi:hypothetical protein